MLQQHITMLPYNILHYVVKTIFVVHISMVSNCKNVANRCCDKVDAKEDMVEGIVKSN